MTAEALSKATTSKKVASLMITSSSDNGDDNIDDPSFDPSFDPDDDEEGEEDDDEDDEGNGKLQQANDKVQLKQYKNTNKKPSMIIM